MVNIQMHLRQHTGIRYGIAVVAVLAGFVLRWMLTSWVGEDLPFYITFYPAVMVAALLGGLGPGLLATGLTVVVVDYWIITPGRLFLHAPPVEIAGVILFAIMGGFISMLNELYRRSREKTAAFEKTLALHESQRALHTSEERFRTMANAMPQLAWIARPDGYLVWYNQRWYQYTGTTPEQMEGWGWQSVHDPVELPKVLEQWKASLATGEPFEMTFPLRGADGIFRLFLTRGFPLKDATGRVVQWFGTNTDVSELKRTEALLAAQRAGLQLILDSTPAMIFYKDLQNRFLRVNRAFADSMGTTKELLEGRSAFDLYPREQAEAFWKDDQEVMASGQTKRNIVEPMQTDTGMRWLLTDKVPSRDAQGKVMGVIGFATDITELRRAEEALQKSESFYRQTLESIPGMIFTTRPDGYCDYQSRQWAEFTGVPMSEHLGDGWNKLLHPDDQPRALAAWRDAVAGRASYDLEYRVRRRDGQYEWFKVRGRPIRDEAGQIIRWFGTALNIDDLVKTQAGLKQTEERLKASLREKEVLLQEIHHRVKNNLQVISSLISLQLDALKHPALRGTLNDVRDRVRTMALVHEKLYQSGDLARVDFADYTASLLQYLWHAYGTEASKVRLTIATEAVTLPVALAIPCGLILNELASNALKHAFRDRAGGEVTAGFAFDAITRQVCLRVRDNGVGMPPNFDWRESRSLGLRLVQMLAEQLHGSVQAVNGPGTEFQVRFAVPDES